MSSDSSSVSSTQLCMSPHQSSVLSEALGRSSNL